MRRAETVMAVVLVGIAGVLLWEATRVPFTWTAVGPGAGFFPFWLSIGVAACAVILLFQSLRAPVTSGGEGAFIPSHAWKPLTIVFLPIVAVFALMDEFGIYLGGALYLAGYMWFVGRHRWYVTLMVSVLVPTLLFLIFENWFRLSLPKGTILELILYGG